MKTQRNSWVVGVCGSVLAVTMLPAVADEVPHSFQASPEVYKVIAEDENMRVGIATWQPGQKDNSHSHPTAMFYTIKDCQARITTPDGKSREVNNKAGSARINKPVKSHTFENIGKTECQQLFVELKK